MGHSLSVMYPRVPTTPVQPGCLITCCDMKSNIRSIEKPVQALFIHHKQKRVEYIHMLKRNTTKLFLRRASHQYDTKTHPTG